MKVIAAKSRRVAVPSVRVTTFAKRRAVFHLSSGGIFECGQSSLKFKTGLVVIFSFHFLTWIAAKTQSKMAPDERFEAKGSNPAAKVPPERRHFAAITEVSETWPL